MPSVQEADDAFEQGDFSEAARLYEGALASGCPDCPRDGEYRKFPKWREATLRVLQARSLRRARLPDQALDALNPVFRMCGRPLTNPPPPRPVCLPCWRACRHAMIEA